MHAPLSAQAFAVRLMALAIAVAFPAAVAAGPIWSETSDAGELPGTAQPTVGSGPLTAIAGEIEAGLFDDVDMFAIFIPDLSLFSATTVGSAIVDSDLFLFDSTGKGVAANGDTSLSTFETNATIPLGSLTGPAGIYFLAVASYPDHPVSPDGDIFPDLLVFSGDGEVVEPTGPGGASPVSAWVGDGAGFAPVTAGNYEIQLEGAEFAQSVAAVPEPTSVTLLGIGLASLAGHGCRKRKRGDG